MGCMDLPGEGMWGVPGRNTRPESVPVMAEPANKLTEQLLALASELERVIEDKGRCECVACDYDREQAKTCREAAAALEELEAKQKIDETQCDEMTEYAARTLKRAEQAEAALDQARDELDGQTMLYEENERALNECRGHRLSLTEQLEQAEKDANTYRIEADCAMRDYDGLELDVGLLRDALVRIAVGRKNKRFDPWSMQVAREALAALGGQDGKDGLRADSYPENTGRKEGS